MKYKKQIGQGCPISSQGIQYGSVCSGIEAASIAWEPLGWKPLWFSEIAAFPKAVLEYNWPLIPNLGDMTQFKGWKNETKKIELLVGGTPCQSFSVTGLRKGLDDPRGQLLFTYLAIVKHIRPRWLVWENVPGVLSSNEGRDFSSFITALGKLGYGWAYRILDSKYFGVAQQRRRIFLIAHSSGSWQYPTAVLFECKDVQGAFTKNQKRKYSNKSFFNKIIKETNTVSIKKVINKNRIVGTLVASHNKAAQSLLGSGQLISYYDYLNDMKFKNNKKLLRILMPIEFERLQGIPDNYTRIPWDRHYINPNTHNIITVKNALNTCPDSHRYKALGNSIAVPILSWIGQRISIVDTLINKN